MRNALFAAIAASIPLARAHIGNASFRSSFDSLDSSPRQAFFDPSMWGWNVNQEDYPYDNRPETPLQQYTFDKWWFVSIHHTTSCRSRYGYQSLSPRSAWALGAPPCIRQLLRTPRRWHRHVPAGLQQGCHQMVVSIQWTHRCSSGRLPLSRLSTFPVPCEFISFRTLIGATIAHFASFCLIEYVVQCPLFFPPH